MNNQGPSQGLESRGKQNSEHPPLQEPSTSLTPCIPVVNTPNKYTHRQWQVLCPYLAKESFQKEPVRLRSGTPKVMGVRSFHWSLYTTVKFWAQNRIRGAVSL